jgi:hypothetical protein
MSKKVTFTPKPIAATLPNPDDWVSGIRPSDRPVYPAAESKETPPAKKTKRFTFDVSETLHRRVKARCAEKGVDIADEMRRLLEQHFPAS